MRADALGSRPRRVGLRLRVTLPAPLADPAASVLAAAALGPIGRQAAAPGAGGEARWLLEAELDAGGRGDEQLPALVAALERLERDHPGCPFELEREERLVEEDAGAVHRDRFAPLLVAPGLVVCPPWRTCEPRPGERVLEIDPGEAFGSGSHASTRLALGLIAECCSSSPPRRMLDVGTGSGVLALAAALWGAAEATGVDVEPQAVRAAGANARRNGLAQRVRFVEGDLSAAPGLFDLVAANLTAEVLVPIADALAARLADGGVLVLSGILAGGQDLEVAEAFARAGLDCRLRREEGEWVAFRAKLASRPLPGGGKGRAAGRA